MIRTFETRLDLRSADSEGLRHVLDEYAALMSRTERQLLAQLKAGRAWAGDLKTSFYAQLGISAVHLDMAYRQLQAKLASVCELAKERMKDLACKAASKKADIKRKEKALKAAVSERLKLPAEIAAVAEKVARRKRMVHTTSGEAYDRNLFALKQLLEQWHAKRNAARSLSARIRNLKSALHQHERHLEILEHKRELSRRQSNDPTLCFGSRKLFRAQFDLKTKGYEDLDAWRDAWRLARSSQFTLDGNSSKESGNQFARLKPRRDGLYDLELRLPTAMADLATRSFRCAGSSIHCVDFRGLSFNHGNDVIGDVLESGKPVCIKFMRDATSWKVVVTVDHVVERKVVDLSRGSIGVDLNAGHVSAALVDASGNPVEVFHFPCLTYGKSSDQAQDVIRTVAAEIATLAAKYGVPVISERLDFSGKKKALKAGDNPRYARMLSAFTYREFDKSLASACLRHGVAHRRVNPAYTSIIGRVKFARRYGLSVHAAASVTIARRAMGFSERLPRSSTDTVTVPTNGSIYVTLGLPARKDASKETSKPRHVWTEWNGLNMEYHKALAALGSSRRRSPRPLRGRPSAERWKSPDAGGQRLMRRSGQPLHGPMTKTGRSSRSHFGRVAQG